jgi:hypothetical protein
MMIQELEELFRDRVLHFVLEVCSIAQRVIGDQGFVV